MVGVGWNFPVLSGGGEEGYTSNDIEAFKGEDLYVNLARETCQNSLDARNPHSNKPVVVKYELRELKTSSHLFFKQYKECIENCWRYWENRPDGIPERLEQLLRKARKALKSKTVKVLVVSDYNTPGLLGSENLTGSFNALVYADGVSYKDSDTSAGSFGIGRNAPFACSDLSCVCYNTKATDGGQAFAGIAKLATTLNKDGKRTRKQGRYQYNDDPNEYWRAIKPSDNDDFAKLFERAEYGTDVIILGFEASEDWKRQLETAVLKNFFLAIHDHKLVVQIQGKTIDSRTISDALESYADEKDLKLTRQYYKAITDSNSDHCNLSVLSENDAELYIRTEPEIESLKNVAWFRGSGMLIKSFRPQGIFRPYVAVFIAKGQLDELLRDTEPARHNDWDYKRIEKGSEQRKRARKAILDLKKEIKSSLKNTCESIIDDTVDAVGAADYLPDITDMDPRKGGGTDMMKPLVKIGKTRKSTKKGPTDQSDGHHGTGKATTGRIGNHRKHPNPDAKPSIPVSGVGNDKGVTRGRGNKTIERPISSRRRIYGVAPKVGLYRLVVIPDKSYKQVFATCSVIGENGVKDDLKVKSAMLDGKRLSVASTKIGPFVVEQGERTELMITFEEHGNLALSVELNTKGEQS